MLSTFPGTGMEPRAATIQALCNLFGVFLLSAGGEGGGLCWGRHFGVEGLRLEGFGFQSVHQGLWDDRLWSSGNLGE